MVIQAIERLERQAIDQAEGGIERDAQLPSRWLRGLPGNGLGVITADILI